MRSSISKLYVSHTFFRQLSFLFLQLRDNMFHCFCVLDIWYDVIMNVTVATSAAKLTTNRFCCVCICITDTRLRILHWRSAVVQNLTWCSCILFFIAQFLFFMWFLTTWITCLVFGYSLSAVCHIWYICCFIFWNYSYIIVHTKDVIMRVHQRMAWTFTCWSMRNPMHSLVKSAAKLSSVKRTFITVY